MSECKPIQSDKYWNPICGSRATELHYIVKMLALCTGGSTSTVKTHDSAKFISFLTTVTRGGGSTSTVKAHDSAKSSFFLHSSLLGSSGSSHLVRLVLIFSMQARFVTMYDTSRISASPDNGAPRCTLSKEGDKGATQRLP